MTAPYVTKLIADIDAARDIAQRAILCAELGCYWARTGDFDRADRLRKELREIYGNGQDIRISILLMSLEGILLYFQDLNPKAHDRLSRAKLLSLACKDRNLISFTSAWVAHLDFNRNNFLGMIESIDICLNSFTVDSVSAECRVALVLGDALLYTGDEATSNKWYERARMLAVKMGDQASIGALTYNRAALKLFNARIASIETEIDPSVLRDLESEVKSAVNYQAIASLKSLDELLTTANINLQLLKGNFESASDAIKQLLKSNNSKENEKSDPILHADLVRCHAEAGHFMEISNFTDTINQFNINEKHIDDRVLILSSLAKTARLSGFVDLAPELDSRLLSSLEIYRQRIDQLSAMLTRYQTTDFKYS
jgi:tetratricopeptide (TPR) repeat protein